MTAAQMLHERVKAGLRQLLADQSKKRTRRQREALEATLAEVLDYERRNPWIVA